MTPGVPASFSAWAGIATAVALVGTLALGVSALRRFASASESVEHTMLVNVSVHDVLEALVDAETGERGFLLTGRRDYLEPYEHARARLGDAIGRLRSLTRDNPRQQSVLDDIERDAVLKLTGIQQLIELRSSEGLGAAVEATLTESDKASMDALRRDVAAMEQEESRLLVARRQMQQRTAAFAITSLVVASVLFGLLLVLAATWRRSAAVQAARLRADNERLAERARTTEFQERFVAILGHDLRNPLSSLSMGLALLKRSPPSAYPATLARMTASAGRMQRMVDQLLDLARARLGGGLSVEPTPVDLRAVVRHVTDELVAAHPDSAVVLDARGDLAGNWDPDRLAQVVSNLVGNAIDHGSSAAPVHVELRSGGSHVLLSVHNAGPEIPEKVQTTLFEPFRRGDREATTSRTSGLGLGLYITREIVLAHGGSIEVTSHTGQGTTFAVTLPRHGPAQ